jgi:DNA-binding transcriptional LysR family regulator
VALLYDLVMDWKLHELRALVAVIDAGTFTDAAIELGVSQAAVSRGIAGLERRAGGRLLRRLPRGCEPTALGQRLLPQARRVVAELAKLDDLLHAGHTSLRLGYAWSAVGKHTTPLLRSWALAHPDIELELVRHNSASGGLAEGMCDASVVRTPLDPQRFDAVIVGLERRVAAFASDDAEWSRRRSLRMKDLASREVIVDPRTGTTRSDLWAKGKGPHTLQTTGLDNWLDAIAAGKGVGMTSEATAVHHPRQGVSYRPVSDGSRIPVWLAWWHDEPPAGITALADALTGLYQDG